MTEEKRVLYVAQLARLVPKENGREEEETNPLERTILDWMEMNDCFVCVADDAADIRNVFRSGAYRPTAVLGVGIWGAMCVPLIYTEHQFVCPAAIAIRTTEWTALPDSAKQALAHPHIRVDAWDGDDFRSNSPQKLRGLLELLDIGKKIYR
jgi:hypothetical protein